MSGSFPRIGSRDDDDESITTVERAVLQHRLQDEMVRSC